MFKLFCLNSPALIIDPRVHIYLYCADVEDASPSVGSIAGGTILTITGKGFDKHAKNISVHVAGNLELFLLLLCFGFQVFSRNSWVYTAKLGGRVGGESR